MKITLMLFNDKETYSSTSTVSNNQTLEGTLCRQGIRIDLHAKISFLLVFYYNKKKVCLKFILILCNLGNLLLMFKQINPCYIMAHGNLEK